MPIDCTGFWLIVEVLICWVCVQVVQFGIERTGGLISILSLFLQQRLALTFDDFVNSFFSFTHFSF